MNKQSDSSMDIDDAILDLDDDIDWNEYLNFNSPITTIDFKDVIDTDTFVEVAKINLDEKIKISGPVIFPTENRDSLNILALVCDQELKYINSFQESDYEMNPPLLSRPNCSMCDKHTEDDCITLCRCDCVFHLECIARVIEERKSTPFPDKSVKVPNIHMITKMKKEIEEFLFHLRKNLDALTTLVIAPDIKTKSAENSDCEINSLILPSPKCQLCLKHSKDDCITLCRCGCLFHPECIARFIEKRKDTLDESAEVSHLYEENKDESAYSPYENSDVLNILAPVVVQELKSTTSLQESDISPFFSHPECQLCFKHTEEIDKCTKLSMCGCFFHRECIIRFMEKNETAPCPNCNIEIEEELKTYTVL